MKLLLSKKDKLILAVLALLLVLVLVYIRFFYLEPLRTDLAMKKDTLSNEQKLLTALSRNSHNSQVTLESSRDLQQKVPVKPMQDQLVLDLEKAETISNSEIKSMNFTEDGQLEAADNSSSSSQSGTNNTQSSAADQTKTQSSADQANSSTGIKKITVQLSVDSPSYEDFETFIRTLESLKRIVEVESINYSGGQEIISQDQYLQPFTYSLTVSAYYMPGLTDLQEQLPRIDAPGPANKENPLSQFADLTNS